MNLDLAVLSLGIFVNLLSLVRGILARPILKSNWVSAGMALVSIVILAYTTIPLVHELGRQVPTIKIATNSAINATGNCAVEHISVDPTDEIKDLQVTVTLGIDRPARESVVERFTDAGRENHYQLEYPMDGYCHPKLPEVPSAHNLAFTLMEDGKRVKIRGRNINNLDAGGIFIAIPGPVPKNPLWRPDLDFRGEATYSVLGVDQDAKVIWDDQGMKEFGYPGEVEIKPDGDESTRLVHKHFSHLTLYFLFGIVAQLISLWDGWNGSGESVEATEQLPLRKKAAQFGLTMITIALLVLSNGTATLFLSRHFKRLERPVVRVVPYSVPAKGFLAGGCAVWGFSVQTNTPLTEFHLVANIENRIHSHRITDGSEFLTADQFKPGEPKMSFPCELDEVSFRNSRLDEDISSDRQQVIMYSEGIDPSDRGGMLLSFYPVKESDPVLAYEWDMSAHYEDWFKNDQRLGKQDLSEGKLTRLK